LKLFPFTKKAEQHFTPPEQQRIVQAIRQAEKNTSGEVRVFIESRCSYVEAIDRAAELFFGLKMDKTNDRNAVLFYIAIKDHQLALFADEGIYQRMGAAYWQKEVDIIINDFTAKNLVEGICHCVTDIGNALQEQFPFESDDKNELPDEIIFGK